MNTFYVDFDHATYLKTDHKAILEYERACLINNVGMYSGTMDPHHYNYILDVQELAYKTTLEH